MQTRSYWRRNNLSFRDESYSAAKGVSMWENAPQLTFLDPGVAHSFYDDFHQRPDSSETTDTAAWDITLIDGAPDNAETHNVADNAAGGIWEIVSNDADNDVNNLQHNGEAWKLATDKALWFEARVNIEDADTADWFVGLCITNPTIMAGTTDRIGFEVPAGDSAQLINFVTEKGSTQTSTSTAVTAEDNTYVKLGFWFDGAGTVYFYANGVEVGSHTTNIPDDQDLTISLEVRAATATVQTFRVDYIKCVQVR